jgi:hypothetical protein
MAGGVAGHFEYLQFQTWPAHEITGLHRLVRDRQGFEHRRKDLRPGARLQLGHAAGVVGVVMGDQHGLQLYAGMVL